MRKFILPLLLLSGPCVQSQTATWADNVACIFYTHCTKCHNPNGIGPFSLLDYQSAFDNASAINDAVTSRYMPPWPPDPNYRSFAHERVLTQQQVDVISNWVNAGAPQGNAGNAPTPPVHGAVEIPNPDIHLQIPTFTLINDTTDDYRCFILPLGISSTSYVTAMEIVPGNRNVVHHVVIYKDTSNVPFTLDANDPNPGYQSFGGIGSQSAEVLGLWVPGDQPVFYPSGMGSRLDPGMNLVVQMHYPEGFLGEVDSTEFRFLITSAAGTREVNFDFVIEHGNLDDGPLVIPADSIKTFHGHHFQQAGFGSATILTVFPHAHLLCRDMEAYAVDINGDTTRYVHIPSWNFHWQGNYWFRQPILIHEGTTIYGQATYDNTSANGWNPNDPPVTVTSGEDTDEEMLVFGFAWMTYQPGDEAIVIDTVFPAPMYNGCAFAIGNDEAQPLVPAEVYPNPATDRIALTLPEGVRVHRVSITNSTGQTVELVPNPQPQMLISLDRLAAGVYYLRAETEMGTVSRKFVVQ